MPENTPTSHVAELIRTQRATRHYSEQTVSEEDLRTILNAGRKAQSSKNTQPWYFLVVRERERLQRLAEGGMYANHVKSAAFAVALVGEYTNGSNSFDLGQSAAYLQLAAWDMGIGSCVTWMHYEEKAKEVLGIPAELSAKIVIAFGYPATQENPRALSKSGRKTLDEVVRWEHW